MSSYFFISKCFFLALLFPLLVIAGPVDSTLITTFERSHGTKSTTVDECFTYYAMLSSRYPQLVNLVQGDEQPFPIVIVHRSSDLVNPVRIMINNGIHPGEPDGVDATMMLVREICTGKVKLPASVELRIIPFYNTAGGKRRGNYSRVNQNGPEEYGFRANGQNLDLNRDFVKMDAEETRWFRRTFWLGNNPPDIFIETHVSNGADYRHTLTLLPTQPDQLGGVQGAYLRTQLVPGINALLQKKKIETCPYVHDFKETPDSGWVAFFDSPRFSSGYASMFNCMAILTETHMLKPFKDRVEQTYEFLKSLIEYCDAHNEAILGLRSQHPKYTMGMPLSWKVDSSKFSVIPFKGYTASYKPSEVSGASRLYYDRAKPYTRQVRYYEYYQPTISVEIPVAYLVPLSYSKLLDNLKCSGALQDKNDTRVLENDTTLQVEVYTIDSFKTLTRPYEGHYLHYGTRVTKAMKNVFIPGGTYMLIKLTPIQAKYLMNTLEPSAPDSYFNWNFFDGILQQKEGFSDYVFEDLAVEWLKKNPELKRVLEEKKKSDPSFASYPAVQLEWVYKNSPYYENTVNQYPVFRILKR